MITMKNIEKTKEQQFTGYLETVDSKGRVLLLNKSH